MATSKPMRAFLAAASTLLTGDAARISVGGASLVEGQRSDSDAQAFAAEDQGPRGAWSKPLAIEQDEDDVSTKPSQPKPQEPPAKNTLSIMTWNVQDLGSESKGNGDGSAHQRYVTRALQNYVSEKHPDIVVLQEVTECSLVDTALPGWSCVGSVVPENLESRLPHVVLGNVLLYNTELFSEVYRNRVLSTGFRNAARRHDVTDKTLLDHHWEKCDWNEYNGCRNAYSDMPSATSVFLRPRPGRWSAALARVLAGGLRVVDVHLFAGGSHHGLEESAKAHRRRFQMRSLLALVDDWNHRVEQETPPMTVYAGDFNTRGRGEMHEVVAPAGDYGLRLWCPADGGWCDSTSSQHKTHRAGTLDHVAVDIRPMPTTSGIPFRARSSVLPQQGHIRSDHSPLFVEFKLSSGVTWPPAPREETSHDHGNAWGGWGTDQGGEATQKDGQTGQKEPVINDDDFPSLG